MSSIEKQFYIGDGAYIEDEGHSAKFYTHNGLQVLTEIWIDKQDIPKVIEILENIK